jgi:hypothetical protein
MVSEVPVKMGGKVIFAAPSFLVNSEDGGMATTAQGIFEVANLLLTFRDSVPLQDRVQQVSDRISVFGAMLKRTAAADGEFADELGHREKNCQVLMTPAAPAPFANTADFLKDLAGAGEWVKLEDAARKHAGSSARPLAAMARRYLVTALANQGDAAKLTEACALALGIVNSPGCDTPDFVQASVLLYNEKRYEDSCNLLKEFAGRYGGQIHLVQDIGQKVFIETKDRDLAAALGIKVAKRTGKP